METGLTINSKMEKLTGKVKADMADVMPGPLYVTSGSFAGEVNLQWDAVQDAHNYIIEISGGKHWQQLDIVSDPQYSISGLRLGRTYLFRISAIFKSGQGPWSKAVIKKIK
ncbi:MAG TPA: fibronectin type III domain-containing protein [Ignavibacteria bacterium]|jgi:hypothetical protein